MRGATTVALPFGHTAVMAHRQATEEGDLDYFPTPPWAARAGGELIQKLDPGSWSCWEPACGEGHMAWGLEDYFPVVRCSDIHAYTTGDGGATFGCPVVHDFLGDAEPPFGMVDWIITNPPFIDGETFVRAAMPRARRGVAMLLRLVFLEGGKRYKLLYEDHPLTVVAPFSERVPMVKGRWDPDASSATAYAWFIWQKGAPSGRLMPIPPGSKLRLQKPEDRARFCEVAPALDLGSAA